MSAAVKTRSRILYFVVAVIGILLFGNAILIYENSLSIKRNKRLLENAEQAKINSLDVIRNIHLMDLALRGYALTGQVEQLSATDSARINSPLIFERLKRALRNQSFEGLDQLETLEDSVANYFALTNRMRILIDEDKKDEFLRILKENEGYYVWRAYKRFSDRVNEFENRIVAEAELNIQLALRNSYLLQFLIFILAVPTLGYMAFFASKTFRVSEDLRQAQMDKNRILNDQNVDLDKQVKEKTKDILAQNEEIKAHNDQLVAQQIQIQKAQDMIAEQARMILLKNQELSDEVERQTIDLRETNTELMEQNSRLQQFTYIISHNLRAPLARLKGLANVLEATDNKEEKDRIYQLMVRSSHELDDVILDLSTILNIQRLNTMIRKDVTLSEIVKKVLSSLEQEINEVNAKIIFAATGETIHSLAPYVESIFYNLLSNAIKYRDPERQLIIQVGIERTDSYVCCRVIDNGLGIDLSKYRSSLFNLYKRFHHHVEGKGLGLYLVKTEMEALGGKIEVDSEVNKGTTFTLYFKA